MKSPKEKLSSAGLNNNNLINNNPEYFKLENELNEYKEQLDLLKLPISEHVHHHQVGSHAMEFKSSFITANDSESSSPSPSEFRKNNRINSKREQEITCSFDELFNKCKKYEDKNQLLMVEIQNLKKKLNM